MKPGVTIAICCHNSRERITDTLRHLAAQDVSNDLAWEILLIDNASTDDTKLVAQLFWDQHGNAPMRIIREEKPGLSNARDRAFREATHEIISFIDDDNWIRADWVTRVADFLSANPEVGAVGGRGYEITDGNFPPWFAAIRRAYACGEQYDREMDVTDLETSLLWGAGLSMRVKIYNDLKEVGFDFMCSGRIGDSLAAGEDVELCNAIRLLGWRLYYDPSLEYQHFIPLGRLTWNYARNLFAGSGRGGVIINILRSANAKRGRYHRFECYWWFQMMRVMKHGLLFLCSHPKALFRSTKGNTDGLFLDFLMARFTQIFTIRKRYRALYEECRERFSPSK